MDKPRILLFAPLCYPPAGSEAIVTSKLVLAMLEAGWKVDVITQGDFGHFYPTTDNGTWDDVKAACHTIHAGRSRLISMISGGHWQSILWAKKAAFLAKELVKKKPYDYMMSRATPMYGHLPALMVSRSFKIPWIANWSDPLPPTKAPLPYGNGPKGRIPLWAERYCRAVCRRVTWHTFPCTRLKDYMNSYLPGIDDRSSVVPHIGLCRFKTAAASTSDEFSICHVGSLTNRDGPFFLEALQLFVNSGNETRKLSVRFVGNNSDKLIRATSQLGLGHVVRVDTPKSYEETQEIVAGSSVCLLIEATGVESVFFPSKFVDYIQTGRPILAITPRDSTVSSILSKNGGGLAVTSNSVTEIAGALKKLYEAWMSGQLDDVFDSHPLLRLFDEKKVLGEYSHIFSEIEKEITS